MIRTRQEWLEDVLTRARHLSDPGMRALLADMDSDLTAQAIAKAQSDASAKEERLADLSKKLASVLAWAEDNPMFDAAYVKRLSDQLAAGGGVTEGQETALDNIIDRWRIDVEDY